MHAVDEFLHNIKHATQQQTGDYAPFAYGHIANYDAKTNRAKVVIVSTRNDDDVPVLSGWMTLGGVGGNGWGMQIAPKGGATIDNPTAGELVVIQRLDRGFGAQAVACMVWNQVNIAPFPELQPGEVGLKSAAGASILLDKDGKIVINTTADVTITTTGNMTLQAAAIALKAASGTLRKLVNDAMVAFFNAHTHPSNGAPPSAPMGAGQLTSVVEAE